MAAILDSLQVGTDWRQEGEIAIVFEPYNSVERWIHESTDKLAGATGKRNYLKLFTYNGQIGRDAQGLYVSNQEHRVDLDTQAGRILVVEVNNETIYRSRRYDDA